MRKSVLNCVKKRILDFFGVYIRRESLPRGVLLKHDVLKLYKGKSLNLIRDVGAHRGETALNFRNAFPDTIIHSFEPEDENFKKL